MPRFLRQVSDLPLTAAAQAEALSPTADYAEAVASGLVPALNAPRVLTASGRRLYTDDAETLQRLHSIDRTWQRRALDAYESTGEVHFGFNLISNIISRIRFFAAAETAPNTAPAFVRDVPDLTPGLAEAAIAAVSRLTRANSLSDIASSMALNLSATGESYLVQTPAPPLHLPSEHPQPESWDIRSIDEVEIKPDAAAIRRNDPNFRARAAAAARSGNPSSSITIKTSRNTSAFPPTPHPDNAFIARIWRRSARYGNEADSSLKAVLSACDELQILNQTFRATARARLNAGVLFVPDGLSVSPASAPNTAIPLNSAALPDDDVFEASLIEAMMTPIQDPSGTSATVPILIRGPEGLGEKIRHITFERTFDPSLVQRADRVLERILAGIDLPREIVSGTADLKFANAIVIEESLLKAHVEPLVLLICDALTHVYLRPALQAAGYTPQQAQRVTLWYDPSEVVSRPNRGADAISAFDRYALSSKALREAHGFNESDAPNPTELVLRMLIQKAAFTPELSDALLRQIAPLMMEAARQAGQAASDNPLPPEISDILNGAPAAQPPQQDQQQTTPLSPAAPSPQEEPIDLSSLNPSLAPAPPENTQQPAPGSPAATPRGPRPGRPATTPRTNDIPLNPPPAR